MAHGLVRHLINGKIVGVLDFAREDLALPVEGIDLTLFFVIVALDWKISKNSNSGFIWGVNEDKMYEHPHETGPEIQVIDADIYGDDPNNQKHTVGALYAMSPPNSIASKKPGEWNQYHITINYETNQGKVILNGTEINNFPLSGDKWDAMVKNSKFNEMSGFGKHKKGHISFQDHEPGTVSYKNIKIRRL